MKDSPVITKMNYSTRVHFLDNIRAFIILLVIVFHVAIGFMDPAPQWWYVVDTQKSQLFNIFVMNTDVFIMPIMFLIAGYFALPVLKRKGTSDFLIGKLLRIGLPWIAGVLIFAPAITYMIWYSRTDTPPNYLFYLKTIFFTAGTFNHAHYWFLGDLMWFFMGLAIAVKAYPAYLHIKTEGRKPSITLFIWFSVVTAAAFFIPNLFFHADAWYSRLYVISFQPTRLFINFSYFLLGIYAWRHRWFTDLGYSPHLGRWSIAFLITIIMFTYYRITYISPASIELKAGHAALHSLFCLTAVFSLLAFFKKYLNTDVYPWKNHSGNSYIIYYIHQLIVLPITYIAQKLIYPVGVKYLIVSVVCVILCYYFSSLLNIIFRVDSAERHRLRQSQR
ncbi:acyltransferase family protein [Dendrosporobacter sp. 1207_IL3150]|uniref:acyltransferase family protein n=1 Tax=Dendrosporobacter sp. 1207_IL3150 TaxID=3084054 RepID=UPI002FDB22C9